MRQDQRHSLLTSEFGLEPALQEGWRTADTPRRQELLFIHSFSRAFVHRLIHPSNCYLLTPYNVPSSSKAQTKSSFQILAGRCEDLGNFMEAKTPVSCWTSEPEITDSCSSFLHRSHSWLNPKQYFGTTGQLSVGPLTLGLFEDQERDVRKGKLLI